VVKRYENLILPNGLAWSMDQTKFYFIDSIAKCIYVYDFDIQSGNIKNKKILRQIEGDIQLPDGMTIDSEGFLWVAIFNGGKVLRIDPITGKTVFEILVPNAKQVTSCTFGGENLDELYITTAKVMEGPYGIKEDELITQQNAGGLFKIKLPYKGILSKRFNN
jgi:sugar lactone lactonase YvrE